MGRIKGQIEGVTRSGKALVHRQRAVLEDVFDEVRADPAYRAAARAQFIADPIGCAEKMKRLFGDGEPGDKAGLSLNIKELYLQAVQGAAAPARQVLDLEAEELPGTARVQPPASDW